MGQQCRHSLHRIDGNAVHHRGLRRVAGRNIDLLQAGVPRGNDHRQHPAHRAHLALQGKLPDEGGLCGFGFQLSAGAQQCQQQRQVVYRAFLFHIGRRQIDGNAADRIGKAGIFHRRPHAVAGLPHRRIRQPDHIKAGQPAGKIRLHLDHKAVYSVQPHAFQAGKHRHDLLSAPVFFQQPAEQLCQLHQQQRRHRQPSHGAPGGGVHGHHRENPLHPRNQ